MNTTDNNSNLNNKQVVYPKLASEEAALMQLAQLSQIQVEHHHSAIPVPGVLLAAAGDLPLPEQNQYIPSSENIEQSNVSVQNPSQDLSSEEKPVQAADRADVLSIIGQSPVTPIEENNMLLSA